MNAQTISSVTQKINRWIVRCGGVKVVMGIVTLTLVVSPMALVVNPARADGLDALSLYDLALAGQGDVALQQLATYAQQLGGWMPAPEDELVFDPYLSRKVRGVSLDYDELPNCGDPKVSMDEAACIAQFRAMERQVRFGYSLFSTPGEDGVVVRPAFGDMLSTYIEEVGHSWQEYQYETNGLGSGARIHATSKSESERWAAGREYQIKRYILNLDGSLLTLSQQQRDTLTAQICGGYANPLGADFPPYGAPDSWPNPVGWPVSAPTASELQAFCAGA